MVQKSRKSKRLKNSHLDLDICNVFFKMRYYRSKQRVPICQQNIILQKCGFYTLTDWLYAFVY